MPRRCEPGLVTVPGWEPYSWLLSGFSTRQGGVSTVYAAGGPPEQNLGFTPQEDPLQVTAMRRRLVDALVQSHSAARSAGLRPDLVTVRQCHSGRVCLVERSQLPLASEDGRAILEGDGLYTCETNLLLGILTADCVPVLVADTRTHAVAAFHAGWRGTVERIVERGVEALREQFGCLTQDLIAAIGPSIGPCCFEVGEDVRESFEAEFGYAGRLVAEAGGAEPKVAGDGSKPGSGLDRRPRIFLNLWEANRRQLLDAGLEPAAITLIGECTACTRLPGGRRKYFSHRAEQGFTGRMLSLIGAVAL